MENDKKEIYRDIVDFHMERTTEDTHSLTKEELAYDLKRKKEIALATVRQSRRKYITQLLINNGIDPSKIDIESILDGNVPEWLLELRERTNNFIQDKSQKNNFKYLKLSSGLLLKLDLQNLTSYKFDNISKQWIEDASFFCEYEHGNLRGEFINFDDVYPTRNKVERFSGKVL